jgi:flagellar biosynthesis/type III secretory pathway chaperone
MDEVDGLCAVMDEEARVCGTLAGVLRDEQVAVVALRPQAILACLEQHRLLHDELSRLSARRRALVQEVAQARGASAASATAILPLLPPDPRERLRARVRRLREALLEARRVERQNQLLATTGLDTVTEILAALRALVPGTRYGADAQLTPAAGGEGLDRHV